MTIDDPWVTMADKGAALASPPLLARRPAAAALSWGMSDDAWAQVGYDRLIARIERLLPRLMPEARRRVLGELGAMMRHQCASWHAHHRTRLVWRERFLRVRSASPPTARQCRAGQSWTWSASAWNLAPDRSESAREE